MGRADNIFAFLGSPNLGNFISYFISGQMSPQTRFGGLADLDLNSIDLLQVFIGDTVFIGNILEYIAVGGIEFFRQNASLTRADEGFYRCTAFGQGGFGFLGKGAERHV